MSQTFLLLASAERYYAIQTPFRHEVVFTKKVVAGMSVGTWLYNILYHCLPLLGWNEWGDESVCCLTDFPLLYLLISDLHYFFFLLGIIVMYTKMFLTAHIQTKKIATVTAENIDNAASGQQPQVGFRGLKAARTTITIVGCFVILTLPRVVTSHVMAWVWHTGHESSDFLDSLIGGFRYLLYINSGINPIIYSLTMRPLRQAMKKMPIMFLLQIRKGQKSDHDTFTVNNIYNAKYLIIRKQANV